MTDTPSNLPGAREAAITRAIDFIADEYRDPSFESEGEWLPPEARKIHADLIAALGESASPGAQNERVAELERELRRLRSPEVYRNFPHDDRIKSIEAELSRLRNERGLAMEAFAKIKPNHPPRPDAVREALEPFATFGTNPDGDDLTAGLMRDRICDWFGPADFRRARDAYASTPSPSANEIERLTKERNEALEEAERLKTQADGEFVRAAVRVMQSNPGFSARDYEGGITADDFEQFFTDDMAEAWRNVEKAESALAKANARIAELEASERPGLERAAERWINGEPGDDIFAEITGIPKFAELRSHKDHPERGRAIERLRSLSSEARPAPSASAGLIEAAERLAQAVNAFRKLNQLRDSPLRDTDEYIELCLAWSAIEKGYPDLRTRADSSAPSADGSGEDYAKLRAVALDVLGALEVLVMCKRTFSAVDDLRRPIHSLREVLTRSRPDTTGAK